MAAKIFFSYSHKDEALRDQLEIQFTMLKRQGLIDTWHDRRLNAGEHLDFNVEKNLDEADVILLLVSPDFLASTYCYDIEAKKALAKVRAGTALLISVIIRPCEWEQTSLPEYVVTPRDGKPVTTWEDRDLVLLDVAKSLRSAISVLPNKFRQSVDVASSQKTPHQSDFDAASSGASFSDLSAVQFMEKAFVGICGHFRDSLGKLKGDGIVRKAYAHFDASGRHFFVDMRWGLLNLTGYGCSLGLNAGRDGYGIRMYFVDDDSIPFTNYGSRLGYNSNGHFLRIWSRNHGLSVEESSVDDVAVFLWRKFTSPIDDRIARLAAKG